MKQLRQSRSNTITVALIVLMSLLSTPPVHSETSLSLRIVSALSPGDNIHSSRLAATSRIFYYDTENTSNQKAVECKTILDSSCKEAGNGRGTTFASITAPACTTKKDQDCVMKVFLRASNHTIDLEPLPIDDGIVTQGSKTPYTPNGGLPGLFKLPKGEFGDDSFIAALVTNEFSMTNGVFRFQGFRANLFPVKLVRGDFVPFRAKFSENGSSFQLLSDSKLPTDACLWTITGGCIISSNFFPKGELGFEYVSGRPMGGWWLGRMNEANLKTTTSGNGSTTFSVSAYPALVQHVPLTDLVLNEKESADLRANPEFGTTFGYPQGDDQKNLGIYLNGQIQKNSVTGQPFTMSYTILDVARRGLGDKSGQEVLTWEINSKYEDGLDRCSKGDQLQGLVTTNALLFSVTPPVFREGALEYEVAGLHFSSDGSEFEGKYTLVVNNDYVKCLYGLSKLPTSATLQIESDNGKVEVGTVLLTSDDTWSTLRAMNFTYSKKVIRANLHQSSTSTISKTTSGNTRISKKKVSALCVKGKVKKIVSLTSKCPKGYKRSN